MGVLAIQGSSRINGNSNVLLEAALSKASELGYTTELVHLSALSFRGCRSCFSCKLEQEPWNKNHACAIQDELTPLLQKAAHADALLIASPIYFGSLTADVHAFLERLWFSANVYDMAHSSLWSQPIPTGFFITMNHTKPEDYINLLQNVRNFNSRIIGPTEFLIVADTCQFANYEQYHAPLFDAKHKQERHAELTTIECKRAAIFTEKLLCKGVNY